MKNKLIYPIYGILFFFLLSVGKLAISKQYDEIVFPGTRWLEADNFVGASKFNLKNNIKIEPIEFAEDISIPELPNLQDVPLTEEDK